MLASAFEDERGGTAVEWVHQCCTQPPMVAVSLRKGHAIEQLIRDSGAFSVAEVSTASMLVQKTFASTRIPDEDLDQFDALPHTTLTTGSPILMHCTFVVDCVMVRHIDLEDEYEMYVGRVVDAIALSRLPLPL
ncbi:MAG: flavin reductase [Phycisphaeraceae bacterium]|nr:flavin reductase [Phycisphaerales bacterium]MCB9858981.1 flavin reductase [Phycisphaeraceae bacterium]